MKQLPDYTSVLEAVAAPAELPKTNGHQQVTANRRTSFDVLAFLEKHDWSYGKGKEDGESTRYPIKCPFCGHEDNRTFVYVYKDGGAGFRCFHGDCNGQKRLKDLQEHFEPGSTQLPDVIIAGQLREYTQSALDALELAENQRQTLFVQSASLVKIGYDEKKHPLILPMGVAELRNVLTRSANFYRVREKGDKLEPVAIAPPKELAEAILALDPHEWPFPPLEAIVETPQIRTDGSILDTEGYDAATHLYYIPQEDLKHCKIPLFPTKEMVQSAAALLDETIGEFPYVSKADRANAKALYITPLVRSAIKRHVPIALIDAPKPGTGKTLLGDGVSIITTGNTSSNISAPDSEEEWDKRITSLLMQGRSIICIDNLSGKLQSSALDSVLTSDEKEGRVLGMSKMIKVANRATWLATGNNIKVGGDLARRCYRIRLDPKVSRPWQRKGFKHEDLATWIAEHRCELITAILTLARAWFLAGQPLDDSLPSLGTFDNWAKMVGGILKYVGVEGFLGNLENLYQEADEESAQWESFLYNWHNLYGDAWKTSAQIVEAINSNEGNNPLAISLPESLQFSLKEKPASFAIRLGKALEKRVDTCYGDRNYRLDKSIDTHSKGKLWRVLADSGDSTIRSDKTASEANIQKFADSADSVGHSTRSETSTLFDQATKHIEDSATNYPHYPQDSTNPLVEPSGTADSVSATLRTAVLSVGMRVKTPAGPGEVTHLWPAPSGELSQVTVRLDSGKVKTFYKDEEIAKIVPEGEARCRGPLTRERSLER